jgi:hypothetical protein
MVAAEAAYGIPLRVRGAAQHKFGKPDGIPFAYQDTPPGKLAEFIETLKAADAAMRKRYGVPLRLVVLDTFAQCFGLKDENSATEVAKATRYMAAIAKALGVAVCAVHHYGKDHSAGLRGSSALKAAADFVITIPAKGKLYLDKTKDAPGDIALGRFALKTVAMGLQTTCIVDEGGASEEFEPIDDGTAEATLRTCIADAVEAEGVDQVHPETGEVVRAARRKTVRARFAQAWKGDGPATRQAFRRARHGLAAEIIIIGDGEESWLALTEKA